MKSQEYIYGIRAVIEALESGQQIEKIYVQRGLQGPLFKELQQYLKKHKIREQQVPVEKLNRFTDRNHQGVLALISPIEYLQPETLIEQVLEKTDRPIFLLLDGISDVRNLGAIFRTAACTGVHGIFLPISGSAPITSDTVKTSAGGVFQVPVAKTPHLKDVIYYLQGSGIKVIAATEKAESALYELDLNTGLAIVMGSEDRGVNPAILKLTDANAHLPMSGEISSLNVSVACGVFLYEAVRQRR